jgi:hypothetical protein
MLYVPDDHPQAPLVGSPVSVRDALDRGGRRVLAEPQHAVPVILIASLAVWAALALLAVPPLFVG